jgi:hypothetical protein
MRVGGRKLGRESVLPLSTTTVSVWTPQCESSATDSQSRPILGPTICYNGPRF